MNKLFHPLLICVLAVGFITLVQAEPASAPADWKKALPGWKFEFPRDYGAHPEFKTEWWYFTGNLTEKNTGRPFGYQLTFFRQGVNLQPVSSSAFALRDLSFAHFTVSDIQSKKFHYFERASRGSYKEVEFKTGLFDVHLGSWLARSRQPGLLKVSPPEKPSENPLILKASEKGVEIDLQSWPVKDPVIHGHDGISQKSAGEGNASHYFSFTRLATRGTVRVGGKSHEVEGTSWFDKEFSTSFLGEGNIGWDWFSLQLDDGSELMIYVMRRAGGGYDPHSHGSHVAPDGKVTPLTLKDYEITPTDHWQSPHSKARYPSGWNIKIPGLKLELTVTPFMRDQELNLQHIGNIRYWEGACQVQGKQGNKSVTGRGYTELTGYSEPLGKKHLR